MWHQRLAVLEQLFEMLGRDVSPGGSASSSPQGATYGGDDPFEDEGGGGCGGRGELGDRDSHFRGFGGEISFSRRTGRDDQHGMGSELNACASFNENQRAAPSAAAGARGIPVLGHGVNVENSKHLEAGGGRVPQLQLERAARNPTAGSCSESVGTLV